MCSLLNYYIDSGDKCKALTIISVIVTRDDKEDLGVKQDRFVCKFCRTLLSCNYTGDTLFRKNMRICYVRYVNYQKLQYACRIYYNYKTCIIVTCTDIAITVNLCRN